MENRSINQSGKNHCYSCSCEFDILMYFKKTHLFFRHASKFKPMVKDELKANRKENKTMVCRNEDVGTTFSASVLLYFKMIYS